MNATFSTRLVALRAARHMTQEELSAAAGVSRSRIGVIETSGGRLPHATTIARLAKALGVKVSALMGDAAAPPTEATPLPADPGAGPLTPEMLEHMITQMSEQARQHRDEMLNKLLAQLSEQAKQHRTELAVTKRDARLQADRTTSFLEYSISTMSSTITTLKETIVELKQQVYGLQLTAGQRMPTAEEQAYFDKQAAGQKKSNPAGFKNYDSQPVSLCLAA